MKRLIRIYRLLLPYIWANKKSKLLTLLTLLLIGIDIVASTHFPYMWKNLISTDITTKPANWFIKKGILLFITWFFIRNSFNLRELSFFPVTNEAIKEIRLKTVFKIHTVSLKNLEKYKIQEIISATGRISQSIRSFMRVSFISIFPSTIKVISLSIALCTADKLCYLIVMAACVGLIAASLILQYYTHCKYKAWHLTDNVTSLMEQNLANTTTIRFNPHTHNEQLKKLFNLESNAWELYNLLFYSLYLIQDFIFYLGAGIAFCLLMFDYGQGIIRADKMILIYGLISSIHSPLVEITRNLTRFFGGFIDINKTLDILNLPSENKPLQLPDNLPQAIRAKELSFSYSKTKNLLQKVSLTIYPGDKIGIFGPSGTGKSTLCQIIAGLIEPDKGNVLYDNLPIIQIDPISLGKILRYVPQINPMQTLYEEKHLYGINLKKAAFSGGEYQLHLLQEALDSNPQIIILDEAINALDKTSARQILTRILYTIPTVIMVSHSHTLLSNMERIFELKDGQLVEIKTN